MPAIKCEALVKRYEDVLAVDGLSLEVQTGECFGLLGPNGAGKTTTTEMLEGLIDPDEGRIEVLGESWGTQRDRQLRERLGVALQETKLTDRITVEETLRLFRSFYSQGRDVAQVMEIVGLTEKRKTWVEKISGGQRQRLALACALVGSPEVLFLDEPTTGLDPQARHRIWEVIEEFRHGGGTVFLTTHYMEEAQRLCDRVGIIENGRLIALGAPQELIDSLQADQIVELRTEPALDKALFADIQGVNGWTEKNKTLVLRVERLEVVMPAVIAAAKRQRVAIVSLTSHKTTLEDVYVHLTGRGLTNG